LNELHFWLDAAMGATRSIVRPGFGRVCAGFAVCAMATMMFCEAESAKAAPPQPKNEALVLQSLAWRDVGPRRSGRASSVAGSAARPYEYYEGSAGGGVFKTIDGGLTWTNVSDG
jgi:hypothetical protein